MRARQQVDNANLNARGSQAETTAQANESIRSETWGASISDGIQTGIDSGAAGIGAAIAAGLNASSSTKK